MHKLFTTLDWTPHPAGMGGEHATVDFPNGYSASVLRGGPFYTQGGTYEVSVMRDGSIDYNTPVTNDVLGYLSEEELEVALGEISRLPEATS